MSETIEIQIGGKPFAFVPYKPRMIQGVRVEFRRGWAHGQHRVTLETPCSYVECEHAIPQTAFGGAAGKLRKLSKSNQKYQDTLVSRAQATRDRRIAQARADYAKTIAESKKKSAKHARDVEIAMAFGVKK